MTNSAPHGLWQSKTPEFVAQWLVNFLPTYYCKRVLSTRRAGTDMYLCMWVGRALSSGPCLEPSIGSAKASQMHWLSRHADGGECSLVEHPRRDPPRRGRRTPRAALSTLLPPSVAPRPTETTQPSPPHSGPPPFAETRPPPPIPARDPLPDRWRISLATRTDARPLNPFGKSTGDPPTRAPLPLHRRNSVLRSCFTRKAPSAGVVDANEGTQRTMGPGYR